MDFVDRELMCVQCGSMFAFSADEQRFFREKGFTNDLKLCRRCKAKTFMSRGTKPVLRRVRFASQPEQR